MCIYSGKEMELLRVHTPLSFFHMLSFADYVFLKFFFFFLWLQTLSIRLSI